MEPESGQVISHYRLLERIGQGGMGVVWRALDTVLGRTVAIKFLTGEAVQDARRRRMFLDEARLASSLSEAHIAQVYELGRDGALDFIVMELVEGVPLTKLMTGHPMPADKVASIGEQVAQALARAHQKKLLHRDVKPGNILVEAEGQVKVVDFGLAVLFDPLTSAALSSMSTLTAPGNSEVAAESERRIAGTLPYMSPEQVRGERLDGRSDVFSLGSVLYEMATGKPPFRALSAGELAGAIARGRVRPVHEVVADVPMELERIIHKALAVKRGDRYQTMQDLAVDLRRLGRDLETGSAPSYKELQGAGAARSSRPLRRTWSGAGGRWVAAIGLVLVCVVAGLWIMSRRHAAAARERTVLILPLEVQGQSEGGGYVGRAFAEAMAVNLAQSEGLNVLPVPPAEKQAFDPMQEGRSRGAGVVVGGTLTMEGKTIAADLRGTSVEENRLLWGIHQSLGKEDEQGLASNVAQEIRNKLGIKPRKLYGPIWEPSGSPEFLASPDFAKLIRIMDDPGMTLDAKLAAMSPIVDGQPEEPRYLAMKTWLLGQKSRSIPGPSPERAAFESSLNKLVTMDPNGPWENIFLCNLAWWEADWPELVRRCTRVLERDDLTPGARAWTLETLSVGRSALGQATAATSEMEEAMKLEPLKPGWVMNLGDQLQAMGRDTEALTYFQRAVALAQDGPWFHGSLGGALDRVGRIEDALMEFKKSCELSEEDANPHFCETYNTYLAKAGRFDEALPNLLSYCEKDRVYCADYALALQRTGRTHEAREAAKKAEAPPELKNALYSLADYHARAGDRAEALRYLKRALEFMEPDIWVAKDPDLQSLHGDPEFESLVADIRKKLGS